MTHLQNLRAEEERLAEEEADDVLLTYDRPETANKVILRRRPSTGTWEIFPSSPSFSLSLGESSSNRRSRPGRERLHQRARQSLVGEGDTASLNSRSSVMMEPLAEIVGVNCNEQESPLTNYDETRSHDSVASHELTSITSVYKDENDSMCDGHARELGDLSSPTIPSRAVWTGGPVKSEPLSPLSTPKTPLSPPPTNHVPDDDSISSRTRHRTSQSLSDLEQSPRHKYPTRHKLQHTTS